MQSEGDAPCLARPCWGLDWGIKVLCLGKLFGLTGVLSYTKEAPAVPCKVKTGRMHPRTNLKRRSQETDQTWSAWLELLLLWVMGEGG